MYGVGFEPTSLSTVELESTPLNHSGIHTYIYIQRDLFKLYLILYLIFIVVFLKKWL
jgi:hypothetical protein